MDVDNKGSTRGTNGLGDRVRVRIRVRFRVRVRDKVRVKVRVRVMVRVRVRVRVSHALYQRQDQRQDQRQHNFSSLRSLCPSLSLSLFGLVYLYFFLVCLMPDFVSV